MQKNAFIFVVVHIFLLFLFGNSKNLRTFAMSNKNGTMAEWLGNGLQNRLQQFDSAWYLRNPVSNGGIFCK